MGKFKEATLINLMTWCALYFALGRGLGALVKVDLILNYQPHQLGSGIHSGLLASIVMCGFYILAAYSISRGSRGFGCFVFGLQLVSAAVNTAFDVSNEFQFISGIQLIERSVFASASLFFLWVLFFQKTVIEELAKRRSLHSETT